MTTTDLSTLRTLYTYTGVVHFPGGAPSIMDCAVQLMREGRYAGAGLRWWPVGLHCFVVADLLPDHLKFHGLMHDSDETVTGDIPSPVKSPEQRAFGEAIRRSIYQSIGVPFPTDEEEVVIKAADDAALDGEVYAGAGTQSLQKLHDRHPEAEELVLRYINLYRYEDLLEPGGRAPIEFLRRFRLYKDLLPTV